MSKNEVWAAIDGSCQEYWQIRIASRDQTKQKSNTGKCLCRNTISFEYLYSGNVSVYLLFVNIFKQNNM